MLRSMYSGISGMKNFQTKLDVIGSNIANVNTAGFKKGRVTFQDMMSQTVGAAQAPTDQKGGINPKQVGLGSQIGTIDNVHTQGNRQTTNRPLDLALEGDGMFVLGETPDGAGFDMTNNTFSYTRAGNFYLDGNVVDGGSKVVNADGLYLMGEVQGGYGSISIPQDAQSFSIQNDGTVTYIDGAGDSQTAGQIMLAKFSNPGGLQKDGASNYKYSPNAGVPEETTELSAPESPGTASIVSGALEMSNVDLADEFTEMITAQRGFQANTKIITTSDEILQELVNLKR